jgi:hypothetical protein
MLFFYTLPFVVYFIQKFTSTCLNLYILLRLTDILLYTGHTQKNGAVSIVFNTETAPFFCVYSVYLMQTNVHCFMLFNPILINVAKHVSSLYKAHLQGLFC